MANVKTRFPLEKLQNLVKSLDPSNPIEWALVCQELHLDSLQAKDIWLAYKKEILAATKAELIDHLQKEHIDCGSGCGMLALKKWWIL